MRTRKNNKQVDRSEDKQEGQKKRKEQHRSEDKQKENPEEQKNQQDKKTVTAESKSKHRKVD
jgi:hypothetical protein